MILFIFHFLRGGVRWQPGRNIALFFCRKQNQTERHHEMWWDLGSWSMRHESCICLLRGLSGAAPLVLLQFVCDAAPSNGLMFRRVVQTAPKNVLSALQKCLMSNPKDVRMSVSNCIAVSPCNSHVIANNCQWHCIFIILRRSAWRSWKVKWKLETLKSL